MGVFAEQVRSSLELFWERVLPVSVRDSQALFERFERLCVKRDLRKRFRTCFAGRKPVTARFFESCERISVDTAFKVIFGAGSENRLSACVLWGSYHAPLCFAVAGQPSSLDKLLVVEGDCIVELRLAAQVKYFFLDGHRGELFRCREVHVA